MKSSYREITISEYEDISSILNSGKTDIEKDVCILELLSGKDGEVIKGYKPSKVSKMLDKAKFLLEKVGDLEVKEFEYGGYKFDVDGIVNMSYGQYIDFENARSISDILHCILIPRGRSYNDGYKVDFGGLRCDIGIGVLNFFIDGLRVSIEPSLKSSLRKARLWGMMHPWDWRIYRPMYNLLRDTVCLLSSRRWRI